MAFQDFPEQQGAVQVLQRSLERGRLAHAYLFTGTDLNELEGVSRTLAKALNCEAPPRRAAHGQPLDSCDRCPSCRQIDQDGHPDVHWVRPESRLRVITIAQMRELMQAVHLKPTLARHKVGLISDADRLNTSAANAFLKTLEEPPADSVLVLLSTEPQRLLDTIQSRCLRLPFAGEFTPLRDAALLQWLTSFSEMAAQASRTLLQRYQLLSVLLNRLNEIKTSLTETLTRQSPLERYEDLEPKMRERLEDELAAAIEAEYRRQRAALLVGLHWWLRDVWLQTQHVGAEMLSFPPLARGSQAVAGRLSPAQALENLDQLENTQRLLASNVQEALTLEVGLLKLHL